MSAATNNSLHEKLAAMVNALSATSDGDDPWWAIAQEQPLPSATSWRSAVDPETSPEPPRAVNSSQVAARFGGAALREAGFLPLVPKTLEETGLTPSEIEALVMKYLLNCGAAPGRRIAAQIRLPFRLLEGVLRHLKESLLVVYKSSSSLDDYIYELTEVGFERARRYSLHSTYFGAAPVSLHDYVASVAAQSLTKQSPRMADIRTAFRDLVLSEEILVQIGQAVNSGLGLFLHGSPGNGKTSIAERIVRAFGEAIWIPRALSVFGEIIRLYDPGNHVALPLAGLSEADEAQIDPRWVRIRRPAIVVGGELTLSSLEITANKGTGISEAPLQLKANCGCLVVDDFGRQRINPSELLNRWIVPLEKRYDFLNLANGRKTQVPFDQLTIFSTNLEPRELVDEAFLRRIPYKIEVGGPSEQQFRKLVETTAAQLGLLCPQESADYLIETHYRSCGRAMRFCHARDLVRQACIYCNLMEIAPVLSREAIDAAVRNYFAMM